MIDNSICQASVTLESRSARAVGRSGVEALAVVLNAPEDLALTRLPLSEAEPGDVVVDIEWSGVSAGTERLLWTGEMPPFPGMGYPLGRADRRRRPRG